ncbi:PGAP1-like alpha/beta domain-containing protein [Desulfogranum marinum]|uniref:PGAP1-like alpha/beta domain-containing protein n=1 Tax=Desulfogranum marinum TaxID=453220 RepID=UPI0019632B8F|nr:FISUMP domain-containing protein [Desulfogranum marinum]MBM9514701.1 hypothetical protein [Desulfogranum marinum]
MFKKIGLAILILLVGLVSVTLGVEVTCLEDSFTRGEGQPVTEYQTFPGIEGPAVLRIYNGAEDDSVEKVSSTVISVNGGNVATPDNFNQNVDYVEVPIELIEGENSLSVQLKSKPGGMIRLSVVQEVEAEAAALVGPGGGTIKTDSGIIIDIPSGSLTKPEIIRVNLFPEQEYDKLINLQSNNQVLAFADFLPDGTFFNTPIKVTFPLNTFVAPVSVLPVLNVNWQSGAVEDLLWECTVDETGYICSGEIDHFSGKIVSSPNFVGKEWKLENDWAWYALEEDGGYRLPNSTRKYFDSASVAYEALKYDDGGWKPVNHQPYSDKSVRLYSSGTEEIISQLGASQEIEPVLFIHGFQRGNKFGGGYKYWGDFHRLIADIKINGELKFIPFDFQWKCNSRFQDVAEDLYNAIEKIYSVTGNRKVHIVAHSFGGLVARTMLQGIFPDNASLDASPYVASLTTLGTPHSGIFDKKEDVFFEDTGDQLIMPVGQNHEFLSVFGLPDFSNNDISVHQAGESTLHDSLVDLNFLGVETEKGEIIKKLSRLDLYPLPENIPIQVAIGLISDKGETKYKNNFTTPFGDYLISYEGQRFHPDLTVYQDNLELLSGQNAFFSNSNWAVGDLYLGSIVTETVLGHSGYFNPEPEQNTIAADVLGYVHSKGSDPFKSIASPSENSVFIVTNDTINNYISCTGNYNDNDPICQYQPYCPSSDSCTHDSFKTVKDWLLKYSNNNRAIPFIKLSVGLVDSTDDSIGIFASNDSFKVTDIHGDEIPGTYYDGFYLNIPFSPFSWFNIDISIEGYETYTHYQPTGEFVNTPYISVNTIYLTPLGPQGQDCIKQISAGYYHTVGLRESGTAVAVGNNTKGELDVGEWRDIVDISAGRLFTIGLKSDGTVVSIGYDGGYGQLDVDEWTDIIDVSAGYRHTVGLKSDGTVVAVGSAGDVSNVNFNHLDVGDWTDIIAVSAGGHTTIGLKADGTVVAAGDDFYNGTGVEHFSDIVAISAGHDHTVGLKADGTVVAVGSNYYGQLDNIDEWTDIISISAGLTQTVGLKKDGTVVYAGDGIDNLNFAIAGWAELVAVSAGSQHVAGLRSDGIVVAAGFNDYGQCDVDVWNQAVGIPTVTSLTGQVWMDRNLGASRVATSPTDTDAYGDLYQWGRLADGHEKRTSSLTPEVTLSSTDDPGHADFIIAPDSPNDWRIPQNDNLWQGVSGINNPCPPGFRLPNEAEWNAEQLSWSIKNSAGAFASPLKLVVAGSRNPSGVITNESNYGFYWSSTVYGSKVSTLSFNSSGPTYMGINNRANGVSVRCIKD